VDVTVATIHGTRLIDLQDHTDARGRLFVLDRQGCLPFEPKRVFYIVDCPSQTVRAEHSVSCHEALVAVHGNVTIDLDNGTQQTTLRLDRPDQALYVYPGVWMRLRAFSPDAVLLVIASETYENTTVVDAPRPELLPKAPAGGRA
jgi:hypothetical protein